MKWRLEVSEAHLSDLFTNRVPADKLPGWQILCCLLAGHSFYCGLPDAQSNTKASLFYNSLTRAFFPQRR